MDEQKACTLISALANGVNPFTGEVFPPESPYQHPEMVRALYAAVRALEYNGVAPQPIATVERTPAAKPRSRAPSPGNVGKPWTSADDQQLLAAFEQGRPAAEIAQMLGRTLAGIEARLEKHGRLSGEQRRTTNRYTSNPVAV